MLLLPFLGGYIFVRFWNYTRIHVLRSDKDRLIIRASLAGLFALVLAYTGSIIGAILLPCQPNGYCLASWWNKNVPFEYSGVSVAAFIIAATAWYPLNWYFTQDKEIDRAINEDADPIELLLKRAQDENIAISITMNNDKIYIGFVAHQFNPATPTNSISIFPLQSGCRESDTKRMNLTTNYSHTYDQIGDELDSISKAVSQLENERQEFARTKSSEPTTEFDERLKKLDVEWDSLINILDRFEIAIPASQIASINYFDKDAHAKYFPYASEKRIIEK